MHLQTFSDVSHHMQLRHWGWQPPRTLCRSCSARSPCRGAQLLRELSMAPGHHVCVHTVWVNTAQHQPTSGRWLL